MKTSIFLVLFVFGNTFAQVKKYEIAINKNPKLISQKYDVETSNKINDFVLARKNGDVKKSNILNEEIMTSLGKKTKEAKSVANVKIENVEYPSSTQSGGILSSDNNNNIKAPSIDVSLNNFTSLHAAMEKWNGLANSLNVRICRYDGSESQWPHIDLSIELRNLSSPDITHYNDRIAVVYRSEVNADEGDILLSTLKSDLTDLETITIGSYFGDVNPIIECDQTVANPYLYVAYFSEEKVYVERSTNLGESWNTTEFGDYGNVGNISLASDKKNRGTTMYLAYVAEGDLYFAKSTDFGVSWSNSEVIVSGKIEYCSISASDGKVIISYDFGFSSTDWDTRYAYSLDEGSSWTHEAITNSDGFERFGRVTISEDGNYFMGTYVSGDGIGAENNSFHYYSGETSDFSQFTDNKFVEDASFIYTDFVTITSTNDKGKIAYAYQLDGYEPYPTYWTEEDFITQQFDVSTSSNPNGGGITNGAGTYNVGASVTVSAGANENYTFINWTEGGSEVSASSSYEFTMPSNNRTLVANFSKDQRTVTLSSHPSDGGTTLGAGTYDIGASVSVEASANENYQFKNWTENGSEVSTNNTYQFTMPSTNRTLVANFIIDKKTVTLSSHPSEGGTTTGAGTYDIGASITIVATANSNYEFINWTENGNEVSTSSTYQFTMPSNNRILVANFAIDQKTVTLSSNPIDGGTTLGEGAYDIGGNVTIEASANDGYKFKNWTEDGSEVSTNNTYQFTISDEDRTLVANFEKVTGIDDLDFIEDIPSEYLLSNCYPNPFNPSTTIHFGLPESSIISLFVFDLTGKMIKEILKNENLHAGTYSYYFNSNDLPSGIYFYCLQTENFIKTKKMILIK